MGDYSCNYCNDNGNCERCSPFFQPNTVHSRCGHKWKDHKCEHPGKTEGEVIYPPWYSCPPRVGV